ncbi:hypothetical protein KP509_23G027300 [Ceratopteris richardii]|uniref:Zinc finger PHD-type domain-containing protein n=1 Tax=Ceratopteris richardii TaxID=49495 RepID=A0A8T2RYE9_CERRI|nr:hypothetical protein KP509_23G027300 [Ceratopteris richardii]
MAKKKQSLPKRSNGLLRQAADVVGATDDVILDEADINRTTTHKKNSSTRSSGDVIFYSPAKVGDFAIYFAEVGLQAAVYHNSMQATIVNGVFDRGTLSVRLYLSVLDKNSMVGVHPISVEDVRLELYWNEHDSSRDLTIEEEEESELNIFLSGYLDCRDDEVSAFIYLFKSGYISVNPQLRIDEKGPAANAEVVCRLAVGISQKSFDGAGELLNSGKTLWSRNMMKLMKWLRPDLHCDEVIYGVHGNMPINECSTMPFKGDGHDSNNRNQQAFNPLLLYEALRPDPNLPPLDTVPQKLLANLRTYQSQAAQWMVMRELAVISSAQDNSQLTSRDNWPFCLQVSSLDEKNVFYYNPFSGVVSRMPVKNFSDVRGGILADEMGLGKTVELLACIMANCDKMSTSQGDEAAKKATEELNMKLKRRKRERIACPCGEDTDDDKGIWVQCDICDVWHHAACVGFGMEFVTKERYELEMAMRKRQSKSPQQHKGKRRKITPDAVFVREERYTVDKDYVCGTCARIIGSVEVEGVCGATLIVCPSSIIGQWQEEIAR